MNGQVKRAKKGSRELIQPGCEVLVPVKEKSNWSLPHTLSIATTSASLATIEHSLNRAAKSMGMAYSKAWRIVNEAEGQLGCKLIERDGARGSTLTPAGERAIAVYEELQTDINNVIATKANDLIASINAE